MEEVKNKTAENATFFGPIAKITLLTCLGTAGIGWGIHLIVMHSYESKHEQAIAKVQYRIDQMHSYEQIYKTKGRAAAIESLKN